MHGLGKNDFSKVLQQIINDGGGYYDHQKGVVRVSFEKAFGLIKSHGENLAVHEDGTIGFHKPTDIDELSKKPTRYFKNTFTGEEVLLDPVDSNDREIMDERLLEVSNVLSEDEKLQFEKFKNEDWFVESEYFKKEVRCAAYKHPDESCTILVIVDQETKTVKEIRPQAYSIFRNYGTDRYELLESKSYKNLYLENLKNKKGFAQPQRIIFDAEPSPHPIQEESKNNEQDSFGVTEISFLEFDSIATEYLAGQSDNTTYDVLEKSLQKFFSELLLKENIFWLNRYVVTSEKEISEVIESVFTDKCNVEYLLGRFQEIIQAKYRTQIFFESLGVHIHPVILKNKVEQLYIGKAISANSIALGFLVGDEIKNISNKKTYFEVIRKEAEIKSILEKNKDDANLKKL